MKFSIPPPQDLKWNSPNEILHVALIETLSWILGNHIHNTEKRCQPFFVSLKNKGTSARSLVSTLNSKRKYTLWVSVGKYSKPTSCRTHERVSGIAYWSSTSNKTEFVKKIQMVQKFWIRVWGYALYQPSLAETDFCELSFTTFQQTFP